MLGVSAKDRVHARSWIYFDQDVEHTVITLMLPRETIDGDAYLATASTTKTKRDRRVFEDGVKKVAQQQDNLNKIIYDGRFKSMTRGAGIAAVLRASDGDGVRLARTSRAVRVLCIP